MLREAGTAPSARMTRPTPTARPRARAARTGARGRSATGAAGEPRGERDPAKPSAHSRRLWRDSLRKMKTVRPGKRSGSASTPRRAGEQARHVVEVEEGARQRRRRTRAPRPRRPAPRATSPRASTASSTSSTAPKQAEQDDQARVPEHGQGQQRRRGRRPRAARASGRPRASARCRSAAAVPSAAPKTAGAWERPTWCQTARSSAAEDAASQAAPLAPDPPRGDEQRAAPPARASSAFSDGHRPEQVEPSRWSA